MFPLLTFLSTDYTDLHRLFRFVIEEYGSAAFLTTELTEKQLQTTENYFSFLTMKTMKGMKKNL